jgi:Na+-driven multidrug efflux pump
MIIGTIEGLITMSAYGLATAVTTLVGQSVGAKKYHDVKKYTFHSTKYAVVILGIFGVLLLFFGSYVARIFTDDADAIEKIILGSRVLVINLPALAVWAVVTAALQGMGDTKSPLYSTIVGMWGIRIISVIILSIYFDFGIVGVWMSIGIDLYMRAIFLSYRFKQNMKKFTN